MHSTLCFAFLWEGVKALVQEGVDEGRELYDIYRYSVVPSNPSSAMH